MTREKDDIDEALRCSDLPPERRGDSWIPIEIWLEELGHPLPPVETQWLIPYEQVRENWLNIGHGMIERAEAAANRTA
jgi:hypothetical protein